MRRLSNGPSAQLVGVAEPIARGQVCGSRPLEGGTAGPSVVAFVVVSKPACKGAASSGQIQPDTLRWVTSQLSHLRISGLSCSAAWAVFLRVIRRRHDRLAGLAGIRMRSGTVPWPSVTP